MAETIFFIIIQKQELNALRSKSCIPTEVTHPMHMRAWNPYMWYLQKVQANIEEPVIIKHILP